MDKYTLQGFKKKYYDEGFEDALLWILDVIREDSEGDLDYVDWTIKNRLNNEN